MTVSSIFSSKTWCPVRTLLLSVVLGGVIIFAMEMWIRALGAVPSFDNSIPRWALVREQAEADESPQAVALLGASRVQAGISHDVLREALPGAQIYNLSYVAKTPYQTLADLADNTDFRGLVILSFMPQWLLPEGGRDDQAELVLYYQNYWNVWRKIETRLGNFAVRHMALRNSYHNLARLARNILRSGAPIEQPLNVVIGEDRQEYLTIPNTEIANRRAQEWADEIFADNARGDTNIDWDKEYADLASKIEKIQARGGRVVMVRMPSTGVVNAAENHLYPRAENWDRMVDSIPAAISIHFEDISGLDAVDLPDQSHIGASDRDLFTQELAAEIAEALKAEGSTRFEVSN